jgi:ribosome-associated translation inhibitor RaiA
VVVRAKLQIEVQAGDGIDLTDQCRAYVEYRMFSAARRFDSEAVRVRVRLEESGSPARASYRCVATADRSTKRPVRVSASATRLHAAVDRAAERLREAWSDAHLRERESDRKLRELAARARTGGQQGV